MFIVDAPRGNQAPLGAACLVEAGSQTSHAAPKGAWKPVFSRVSINMHSYGVQIGIYGALAPAIFFSEVAAVIRRVMNSRTFGILALPSSATARAGPWLATGSAAYQY